MLKYVVDFDVETLGVGRGEREGGGGSSVCIFGDHFWKWLFFVLFFKGLLSLFSLHTNKYAYVIIYTII